MLLLLQLWLMICHVAACPPPDAFRIVCRTDQLPQCGPGAKPINLANFCTAFPIGAQLSWIRATITAPAQSGGDVVYGPGIPVNPGIAYCPAGANGSNVWYPAITSFNGLTNCFCTAAATCQFTAQSTAPADTAAVTQNTAINITLFGKQGTSRWFKRALTALLLACQSAAARHCSDVCGSGIVSVPGLGVGCILGACVVCLGAWQADPSLSDVNEPHACLLLADHLEPSIKSLSLAFACAVFLPLQTPSLYPCDGSWGPSHPQTTLRSGYASAATVYPIHSRH